MASSSRKLIQHASLSLLRASSERGGVLQRQRCTSRLRRWTSRHQQQPPQHRGKEEEEWIQVHEGEAHEAQQGWGAALESSRHEQWHVQQCVIGGGGAGQRAEEGWGSLREGDQASEKGGGGRERHLVFGSVQAHGREHEEHDHVRGSSADQILSHQRLSEHHEAYRDAPMHCIPQLPPSSLDHSMAMRGPPPPPPRSSSRVSPAIDVLSLLHRHHSLAQPRPLSSSTSSPLSVQPPTCASPLLSPSSAAQRCCQLETGSTLSAALRAETASGAALERSMAQARSMAPASMALGRSVTASSMALGRSMTASHMALGKSMTASSHRSMASASTAQDTNDSSSKETISVTFINRDGSEKTVSVPLGTHMLQAAHDNDIDLEGACEASLACSTCHVIFEDESMYDRLPEPSEEENDMLDLAFGLTSTSRLGCQILATPDLDGACMAIPSASGAVARLNVDATTRTSR